MKLRFGEIEQVLQLVHDVPADASTQFRARIRNLLRVGLKLPSGGAGRRANYHPADLFKIAFAVELLQAGLPPEPAAVSVAQYWPDLVEQLFSARAEMQGRQLIARYLIAEPATLTRGAVFQFKPETGAALADRLSKPAKAAGSPRLLIINAAAMLRKVEIAVQKIGLDWTTFNACMDEHQAIILKQGAKVRV